MKNTYKAFTLIEILTVLALMFIIFFLFSSLDFGTLSSKQKAEIFTNKIVSQIEETRNNALIGKSIFTGSTEIIPEGWKIIIKKEQEEILTKYIHDGNEKIFKELDFLHIGEKNAEIKQEEIFFISCSGEKVDSIEIEFDGKDSKIIKPIKCKNKNNLKIYSGIKPHSFIINFDTINTIIDLEYEKN